MPAPLERCSACQRTIGQYEMPRLWQETLVCPECYARLTAAARPAPPRRLISPAAKLASNPTPPAPPAASAATSAARPTAVPRGPSPAFTSAAIPAPAPSQTSQWSRTQTAWTPPDPSRVARAAKFARGLLIALGIAIGLVGLLAGGVAILTLIPVITGHNLDYLDVVPPILVTAVELGIGITFLIVQARIPRRSRPAVLAALILAYGQTALCLLALLNSIKSLFHWPSLSELGPNAPAARVAMIVGVVITFTILGAFFALLIPLLICLHRLLKGGSSASRYA